MKKSKLLTLSITTLLVGSLFMGCGSSNSGDSSSSESAKYIIATDSKYAPFSFEEDGKYKGIDVEILAAIAEESAFEYELKPMDFNGIIPGLTSNQLDGAIAGMSITDERKEALDFSDGYFESGLSIVVKGDNEEINGIDDLNGKTVAVKKGTAGENWALENKIQYNLELKHYEDSPSMFMAVTGGYADFALEDFPVIAYSIKLDADGALKIAGDKVTTANYGFAVNKGKNSELLEKFQAGLKAIKENGKYDEIISEYIN